MIKVIFRAGLSGLIFLSVAGYANGLLSFGGPVAPQSFHEATSNTSNQASMQQTAASIPQSSAQQTPATQPAQSQSSQASATQQSTQSQTPPSLTQPTAKTSTQSAVQTAPAAQSAQQDDASQMSNVLAIMQAAKKSNPSVGSNTNNGAITSNATTQLPNEAITNNVAPPIAQTSPVESLNNQDLNSTTSSITEPQAQNMNTLPSANPANNTLQNLEAELSQLNQSILLFQQQDNQRIEDLAAKNNIQEEKIQKLGQALLLLDQEVGQLTNTIQSLKHAPISQGSSSLGNDSEILSTILVKYEYLFIFLVIAALAFFAVSRIKPRKKIETPIAITAVAAPGVAEVAVASENDTEAEYDYLGSNEAIPAKLDLARAYIAMEDFENARKVLDEVISVGNKHQQQEARSLLEKTSTE